jgi:hypothetical protein
MAVIMIITNSGVLCNGLLFNPLRFHQLILVRGLFIERDDWSSSKKYLCIKIYGVIPEESDFQ